MQQLLKWFSHNWERKLLACLIVLLGGLFFTWRIILETPPTPTPRQISLPTAPHLFQWEDDTPEFLMANECSNIDNPFLTQFPLEKPLSEPQITQAEVVISEKTELPPMETPKRTIVITFQGIRTALSGKIYAILEIADSDKGVSTAYLKKDATLECGFKLTDVTEQTIRFIDKNGAGIGEINYGDTRIFTLDTEE